MGKVNLQQEKVLDQESPPGDKVVEIGLLLSAPHLTALAAAAEQQGISPGTLARRLIVDFLFGGPAGSTSTPASK
jgi:hypothetical protein